MQEVIKMHTHELMLHMFSTAKAESIKGTDIYKRDRS